MTKRAFELAVFRGDSHISLFPDILCSFQRDGSFAVSFFACQREERRENV